MRRWQGDGITRRSAFTILELLVALSITAVIVFFVGLLFSRTSHAVSRGANLIAIAAKADTGSEQFNADFDDCVFFGPHEDGVLVIMHHAYRDVPINHYLVDPSTVDSQQYVRDVRSDQLVFLRDAGTGRDRIRPVVPGGDDAFDAPSVGGTARIWYGHVQKTHPIYGVLDMNKASVSFNVGSLKESDDAENINLWGDQWILGRQALFLKDAPTGHPFGAATGVAHQATVEGAIASSLPNWFGPARLLYMGLADFANVDHTNSGGDHDSALISTSGVGDGLYWLASAGCVAEPCLNDAAYKQNAYELAYPTDRLWANAEMPPTYPLPGSGKSRLVRYESWRVAQAHPVFLENASDFAVEFAADIDPLDGEVDTYIDPVTDETQIKWYTSPAFANSPFDGANYDRYEPATFAVSDPNWPPQETSAWPVLAQYGAFVWRHDSDHLSDNHWPYLIRIRYRLHDKRGEVGEAAGTANRQGERGLWFEDILVIDRD